MLHSVLFSPKYHLFHNFILISSNKINIHTSHKALKYPAKKHHSTDQVTAI